MKIIYIIIFRIIIVFQKIIKIIMNADLFINQGKATSHGFNRNNNINGTCI
jgi:hypothetical protein